MTGRKKLRVAEGPIEAATSRLASWLEEITGAAVSFGAASGKNAPEDSSPPEDALCLWPLQLRPERQTRTAGGGDPTTFRVRHLVAPAHPVTEPESLRMLDQVLVAAVRAGEPEICPEPPEPQLWLALGATPRPALLIDVAARVLHQTPTTPLVRHPLRLQHADVRPLRGQLIGPGDQPVAGMRVAISGIAGAVYTNSNGIFQFAAVPVNGPVELLLQGRNRSLTAHVDPSLTEPLVIHCHFEES